MKMTLVAQKHCKDLIDGEGLQAVRSVRRSQSDHTAAPRCRMRAAFNACAKGRNFSMLWSCKGAYDKSQDCFHL